MSVIYLTYANNEVRPLRHLREEDDEIDRILSESTLAGHFFLKRDQYTSPEKIEYHLLQFRSDLEFFGYSGHANGDALITEGRPARAEGIAHLLGMCPNLKVVFLNGCSTRNQVKALLTLGIPAVIATHVPVNDETAKAFAIAFFRALNRQDTLELAFNYARGVIMDERKQKFHCLSSRGFDTNHVEDGDWGLFWSEGKEEILQWKLPSVSYNTILNDTPPSQDTTKVFFLCDKRVREDYYQKIKNSFREEIKGGQFVFNDLYGIGEPIERGKVIQEVDAADVNVFLVNGSDFMTLWDRISWVNEVIRHSGKPFFYVKLPGEGAYMDILQAETGKPRAKLPKDVMFEDIVPSSLERYIFNTFKRELLDEVKGVRSASGVSPEKLEEELLEFDLTPSSNAFKVFKSRGANYHFVAIQGTDRCGQALLLKRLLSYLPRLANCPKFNIDFNAGDSPITRESQLWEAVSEYLTGLRIDNPASIGLALAASLKEKDILFVLENVATQEMSPEVSQSNLELIASFWNKVLGYLPEDHSASPHQLFLFAINRATHCGIQFSRELIEAPHTLVLDIELIDNKVFTGWHEDKSWKFRGQPLFDHLIDDSLKVVGDGHLSDVVFRICDGLKCIPVYAKLIPR